MYGSAEGNQFIMIIPDKEVLFNEIRNVPYYYDLEDCDLLLVKTVEKAENDYTAYNCQGPGRPGGHCQYLATCHRKIQAYGTYHKEFPSHHCVSLQH